MRRLRQFLTETSGAAAIEFAILSPLFALLLSWMVSIGFQALTQGKLNEAVRETAEAALFTQDTEILNGVLDAALSDAGFDPDDGSVDRSPEETSKPIDYIIILVKTPFTPLFSDPIELESVMEVQVR